MNAFAFGTKVAFHKFAGPTSELLSGMNPLNMYGGGLLGGIAALATPTRSLKNQAEIDSSDNALRALTNVLVPGVGPYRGFKRIGAGIRSPEMKAIKAERLKDKARRELESLERAQGSEDTENKEAGWKTEALGMTINPGNVFGGSLLGGAVAGLTPTRTLPQQAEADESTWSNIFVPGAASYNYMKRIGAATRSPEMLAMRRKALIERLERESGKNDKQDENKEKTASAFEFGAKVAFNFDPRILGGLGGAAIGGLGGAALGALDPGYEEDENGVRRRRSRLRAALSGALAGAGVGGLGGAAYGHFNGPQVNAFATKMRHMYNRNTPLPTPEVQVARDNHAAAGAEPFSDDLLGDNPAMAANR